MRLELVLSISQKYIAKEDNSLMYISVRDLSASKQLGKDQKLCLELFAYPIDLNAMCESQLVKEFISVPNSCESSFISSPGYNV